MGERLLRLWGVVIMLGVLIAFACHDAYLLAAEGVGALVLLAYAVLQPTPSRGDETTPDVGRGGEEGL